MGVMQQAQQMEQAPADTREMPVVGPNTPANESDEGAITDDGAEEEPNVTPEEQMNYERAAGAMMTLLYKDAKTTDTIAAQINEKEKIGSPARVALNILKHINDKLQPDSSVIPQLTQDLVDELLQIGEEKGITYSKKEAQLVLSTAWEGVTKVFGGEVDTGEALSSITDGMNPDEIAEAGASGKRLFESYPAQPGADNGPPLPDAQPNPEYAAA